MCIRRSHHCDLCIHVRSEEKGQHSLLPLVSIQNGSARTFQCNEHDSCLCQKHGCFTIKLKKESIGTQWQEPAQQVPKYQQSGTKKLQITLEQYFCTYKYIYMNI